jgi:predicted RNA-binding Zn ribbon-like protein
VCTAPRCDRVYVDTSRNGTRRFCSTTCQNRVKAATFRERKVPSAGYGHGAENPLSAS